MTKAATYSVCLTYYGLFLHGFIISRLFAPTKSMQTSERKKFVPNKKGYVGMVWSQSLTTPQLQHPIKIP